MGNYPTAKDIRAALIQRVEEYCDKSGTSASAFGRSVLRDSSFVPQLKAGRNVTLDTYETVMRWLDEHWPQKAA